MNDQEILDKAIQNCLKNIAKILEISFLGWESIEQRAKWEKTEELKKREMGKLLYE